MRRASFAVVGAAVCIPLLAYGLLGANVRLIGDDYCYAAWSAKYGFFGSQLRAYFESTPFSGNRYSLTGLSSIAGLFRPWTTGVWPGLLLGLWVLGMALLLRNFGRRAGVPLDRFVQFLVAAFIVFLVAYQAPDPQESILWRSGSFPYLAPLVLLTFLLAWVLAQHDPRQARRSFLIAFGLALIVGGFSETTGALQVVGLSLLFLLGTVDAWRPGSFLAGARPAVEGGLLAAILAMTLLAISPSNRAHFAILPHPNPLLVNVRLVLTCPLSFVRGSSTGNPIPTFLNLFLPAYGTMTGLIPLPASLRIRPARWALVFAAGYALLAAVCAPSIFTQGTYPGLRAQISHRFVMVLGLAALGALLGSAFRSIPWTPVFRRAAPVVGILLSLYTIRSAPIIARELPRYRAWARAWDLRDQEIRWQRDHGERRIVVVKLDHIFEHVAELGEDRSAWYNGCAADAYQVDSIEARIPDSGRPSGVPTWRSRDWPLGSVTLATRRGSRAKVS